MATGQARRGVVSPVNVGAGSITLTANLGLAPAPGDTVRLMTNAAPIPVGATTKDSNAPSRLPGPRGPGTD